MAITTRRIPVPTTVIEPGDVLVQTLDDRTDIGLAIQLEGGRSHFLALARLRGEPEYDATLPRLCPLSGSMAKVVDPIIARPLISHALALEGDPCSGALVLTPKGKFVRVEMHGQVAYFGLETGLPADPDSPRVYYPQWALAADGPDERIIVTVGAAVARSRGE